MGGRLALYLAIHYPKYFSRIILESASPGLKTAEERRSRRRLDHKLANQLEETNFRQFLTNWYNLPLFHTLKNHPQFQDLLKQRLNNRSEFLAKSLREMGTGQQPPLWNHLTKNKIPLLLVVGEKDAKFRAIADEMAQVCPTAQVKICRTWILCSGRPAT